MPINIISLFVAALIPMVVGFVYYHPKVMGTAWMSVTGITEEDTKNGPGPVVFIVSYIFSFLLAFILSSMVVHQQGVASLFIGDEGNELLKSVMTAKHDSYRTFGHGAFHGFFAALTFVLPVLGTSALFEMKGWKYIWVNVGYWAITLTIMGGIICAWMPSAA